MYDLYLETLFSFTHIFLGLSCSCTSPLPSFLPPASSSSSSSLFSLSPRLKNIIFAVLPLSPPALRLAWNLCSAFYQLRRCFPCAFYVVGFLAESVNQSVTATSVSISISGFVACYYYFVTSSSASNTHRAHKPSPTHREFSLHQVRTHHTIPTLPPRSIPIQPPHSTSTSLLSPSLLVFLSALQGLLIFFCVLL
ncbi:hypothetical protein K440DRAFT_35005 [Wilcoxina mikolae CBS 423.85]|nr:hypothetical protein K440DRAFT_35005 [Wilcoxina mikolae CBS 423.85]